jgi:hypothetical protein
MIEGRRIEGPEAVAFLDYLHIDWKEYLVWANR